MLGAFAGNRLGAVRDAKGKSVAAVFSELNGNQRAEVNEFIKLMVSWFDKQNNRSYELWPSKFWALHCRSPEVPRYLVLTLSVPCMIRKWERSYSLHIVYLFLKLYGEPGVQRSALNVEH